MTGVRSLSSDAKGSLVAARSSACNSSGAYRRPRRGESHTKVHPTVAPARAIGPRAAQRGHESIPRPRVTSTRRPFVHCAGRQGLVTKVRRHCRQATTSTQRRRLFLARSLRVIGSYAGTSCRPTSSPRVQARRPAARRVRAAAQALLSKMPEVATTCENLADSVDAPLSLTHHNITPLSSPALTRVRSLVDTTLAAGDGQRREGRWRVRPRGPRYVGS